MRELFSGEAASVSSRSLIVPRAVDMASYCVVSDGADGKFSPPPFDCESQIRIHLENIPLARIFQEMGGGGL